MERNLTIITNGDRPLAVKIDNPRQLDRMLKDVEVPYVRAFLNYLSENFLEIYAGGSLIENTLFGGEEPSDIDLLAITDKPVLFPGSIFKLKISEYAPTKKQNERETISYDIQETIKAMYFHITASGRKQKDGIQYNKLRNYSVRPIDIHGGRPIDLTVVPNEEFEKGARFFRA